MGDTEHKPHADNSEEEEEYEFREVPEKAEAIVIGDTTEDTKEKTPKFPAFHKIFAPVTCSCGMLIVGLIAAAANGISLPIFSIVFGELFNDLFDFIQTGDEDQLNDDLTRTSVLFILLMVYTFIAAFIQTMMFGLLGEFSIAHLRKDYFSHLLDQEPGYFDDISGTGVFTDRLSKDIIQIQNATEKIGNLTQHLSALIAGIAVAFGFSPQLAGVVLAVSPLIFCAGAGQQYFLTQATTKGSASAESSSKIPREAIRGFRTITSLNLQNRLAYFYDVTLYNLKWVGYQKSFVNGSTIGLTFFIFFCVYGLSFWYAGTLVESGDLDAGDILVVIFAIIIGFQGLGQAAGLGTDFSTAAVTSQKLYEVIERNPKISINNGGKQLKKFKGNISFKNVEFSYPTRPDNLALNGFSLKIRHGHSVALVGPSGSGKSTVIALIERFYSQNSGQILFDDVPVEEINLKWLRDQIALVSQEPVLFSGTFRENIACGKPSATDDEIVEAARVANAYDFISKLPRGFETLVGESGTQLSGGQKQRIAIARAVLKDPKILLLDEATSALDNKSEEQVQEALDRIMHKRTTIMIAHRLTTVINAHKIVVIKKGKVAESGSHAELLKKGGIYSHLFNRQIKKEEEEEEESESN